MMKLAWRRPSAEGLQPAEELLEVVTPRMNAAVITPAEHLCAALALGDDLDTAAAIAPVSLEIAGDHRGRRFLARAASAAERRDVVGQLGAAYPQAMLRPLGADEDPAGLRPGEQLAACTLVLRHPPYLPLRTFRDDEVDATRSVQADPVLGILGAMGDLPTGWRAISQMVLRPAPADWSRPYLRLGLEHPLATERQAGAASADTSLGSVFVLLGLLLLAGFGLEASAWYRAHDWGHLAMLVGGGLGLVGLVVLILWLRRPGPLHDPKLVQDKLRWDARVGELRLAVVAPATAPREEVQARLGPPCGRVPAVHPGRRQRPGAPGRGPVARESRHAGARPAARQRARTAYPERARAGGAVAPAPGAG
jgi:hypothetical protein